MKTEKRLNPGKYCPFWQIPARCTYKSDVKCGWGRILACGFKDCRKCPKYLKSKSKLKPDKHQSNEETN